MGSHLNHRLAAWFDKGLTAGRFDVPNGRHIVLNQFPRLMKESRLRASAAVSADDLRYFFLCINPNVVTVADGSPSGMVKQLSDERDQLPAVRRIFVPVLPDQRHEQWYVYTPPLAMMRNSWRELRARQGLDLA